MKPNFFKFVFALMLVMGISRQASAVDVQLIHNSPDPALASVDIYAISPFGPPQLVFDNLEFRQIVHQNLPLGGLKITLAIAPGNSSSVSDTFYSTSLTFDNSKNYVFVLQGLKDPGNFSTNPNGKDLSFTVLEKSNARTTASKSGNFDFFLVNGAPDDSSKILTIRGTTGSLVKSANFAYGDTTTYFSLPSGNSYIMDVYDRASQALQSTYLFTLPNTSSNGPSVGTVIYSGFADSAANQNGKSAGWFMEIPSGSSTLGSTIMLQKQTNSFLQLIHNSADPSIDTFDVWVNGEKVIENLGFRAATGTIPVPSNEGFTIKFTHKNSASDSNAFYSVKLNPIPALIHAALIARGVLDPNKFQPNPNGADISFGLTIVPTEAYSANGGETDVKVFHGITDLGYSNVRIHDSSIIFKAGPYNSYNAAYIPVPSKLLSFDVTDTSGQTKVAAFRMDLSPAHDSSVIILLSGFMNSANNQNGAPARLIAVMPNGQVITATDITGIAQNEANVTSILAYPNPAHQMTNIAYTLSIKSSVIIRLTDQTGRILYTKVKGNQPAGVYNDQLQLGNLSNGLYLLNIQAGNQISHQWISKQ